MKIAIIGYGRMGRLVEKTAIERGHSVVCRIDKENTGEYDSMEFRSADVAIQFSTPDTAVYGIMRCFAAEIPVVCGTTGWTASLPEIRQKAMRGEGTIIFSSNFSIGVNIFMAVNRCLARIMADAGAAYTPRLNEVHHIHKLDHPSGTAITLAEELIAACPRMQKWKEVEKDSPAEPGVLGIEHERRGEVPGIHSVRWQSPADSITITHSACSREGFAIGAVIAAEWIRNRRGFLTMRDMLDFNV